MTSLIGTLEGYYWHTAEFFIYMYPMANINPDNIQIDPEDIKRTAQMWENFVSFGKFAIGFVVLTLIVLAFMFL